ncbi:MAG TPA: hypothetical protein VFT64_08020 [Rickettsiales bacterium]|nr:hypothetical protein [Rickettsiales bacterium]
MQATIQNSASSSSATDAAISGAVTAFNNAEKKTVPYTYWLFEGALPTELCKQVIALPIQAAGEYDTQGKRDSHNELRRFFSPQMQAEYGTMKQVADIFQNRDVIRSIEQLCGISCAGSYLRIEYCQDKNGFWLEPHMDIKEKLVTIQIYLNTGEDAQTLGTDIYNADKSHFGRAPSFMNQGMIFVPKEPNSYHGFEKRKILDTRRSLIINYVTDDWRARHELSFPQEPVSI